MKNKQKTQKAHESTPQTDAKRKLLVRMPSLTPENILKWSKGRVLRIITAIIAVIVFVGCINEAFDYTENAMSDEAYKYSDKTYENIELAVQNYLGADGPDIATLQENVPEFITRYTISYENNKSELVCTKENGLFCAVVTFAISKDFKLQGSPQKNFNSFQEYKDFFWKTFKVEVAKRALGMFLIIAVIWFVLSSVLLFILKKVVENKENKTKNKEAAPNSVTTTDNPPVEVAIS